MAASKICVLFVIIQLIYVISTQEVEKRVPHGFVGMRGKKFIDTPEFDRYFKRKPQFFVGVKGKKDMFNMEDSSDPFFYKRVPLGFVGMRGKKEFDNFNPNYPEVFDIPKLDGSLIGKIDYSTNEDLTGDINYSVLNHLFRYLQHGGDSEADSLSQTSRDLSNERITNEVNKRAANIHQFFGVRGKKSIQNKRPYDLTFRGKFIGVRGKKDLKNSSPQEIKFLLDQNMPWPKRKAQMGFFGMRGKKWTNEAVSDMETPN